MGRDSALMAALRFLQDKYKYFAFLDCLARPFFRRNGDTALLCLLAPPRSGSTLTYQVLSSAFSGYSLRNISNFLYATPTLGYAATKKVCRKHKSFFRSKKGFVPGLCGEAEGMKFWWYWLGQGLEQRPEKLNAERLRRLKNALDRTGEPVMMTGYLGHVFAVSALRKVFSKVLFVHLKRDLLSNAYSLLQLTSGSVPFSICPIDVKNRGFHSRHHLVVEQLQGIHDIISGEYSEDMLQVNYEDLCDDTQGTLRRIAKRAEQLGIVLKQEGHVPESFPKRMVSPDKDEDAARLEQVIRTEFAHHS